jgi:hypothetical protein
MTVEVLSPEKLTISNWFDNLSRTGANSPTSRIGYMPYGKHWNIMRAAEIDTLVKVVLRNTVRWRSHDGDRC